MIGEQVTQGGPAYCGCGVAVVFRFLTPSLPKTLPLHSEIRCDETVLAHFCKRRMFSLSFPPFLSSLRGDKKGFCDII